MTALIVSLVVFVILYVIYLIIFISGFALEVIETSLTKNQFIKCLIIPFYFWFLIIKEKFEELE